MRDPRSIEAAILDAVQESSSAGRTTGVSSSSSSSSMAEGNALKGSGGVGGNDGGSGGYKGGSLVKDLLDFVLSCICTPSTKVYIRLYR